jgi:hypothetical protein
MTQICMKQNDLTLLNARDKNAVNRSAFSFFSSSATVETQQQKKLLQLLLT